MSEEIEVSKQWIAKARNDLLNADNNLKAEEIPFDTVCFHCQQAAEKFLKAYLVANGISYPITHDLALLMPYAVEIRYPGDWFMPTEEDAKEAREAVSHVTSWLQNAIPEVFAKSSRSQNDGGE